MVSRERTLVRLMIALLLIGGFTTNCKWLRRFSQSPRQHWWEFWKPKKPSTDFYYPSEDFNPEPPPPAAAVEPLPGVEESPVPIETAPGVETTEPAVGVAEAPRTRQEPRGMVNQLQTVHFAFDSFALSAEARRILDKNAEFLLQHPDINVLIEGHCDERGTAEYNLNLGQKRADAVREYLISKGVAPERLQVISYGEERPIDPGHNEEAWAKNRRAQFQIY